MIGYFTRESEAMAPSFALVVAALMIGAATQPPSDGRALTHRDGSETRVHGRKLRGLFMHREGQRPIVYGLECDH